MDELRALIRDIPDFPKKGIVFKDVTPLLADARAFRRAISAMAEAWNGEKIAKVVGIESRGFIFAAPLALELNAGLVIVRKPGKLPFRKVRRTYALEYGSDTLELHEDAIGSGERVLVIDDLLATGGTANAVGQMVVAQGGGLAGYGFLIELGFLDGRKRLQPHRAEAVLRY